MNGEDVFPGPRPCPGEGQRPQPCTGRAGQNPLRPCGESAGSSCPGRSCPGAAGAPCPGAAEDAASRAGIRVTMRAPCRFCRREWTAWLTAMRNAAAAMLGLEENGLPSVELIITDDGDIALTNARRLGCTGPTNILSFPEGGASLGTLLLSTVTLERECVLYGQEPAVHARRLLAHGMGHLSGLDHGPAMDEFCALLEAACAEEAPGA